MWTFAAIAAGIVVTLVVLIDAFETILLPRTITRGFRLTRVFYRATWGLWARLGRQLPAGAWRETFLSFFGPLSVLGLTACWAGGLILSFGMLQWVMMPEPHTWYKFGSGLYLSGNLFFTLGLGDVNPQTHASRSLAVLEAGLGFGFLACIIGYLPVLYAGFARREIGILRLDVRAGSPPTAAELLRQHEHRGDERDLDQLLRDYELWAAELLEAHLSYPILCMYRSQHRDQSWLATLTTLLDTCALLIAGLDGVTSRQAPVTFAMARRAVIDLAHLFRHMPVCPAETPDRLPAPELDRLRRLLGKDARLREDGEAVEKLARLRVTYEPAAQRISEFLLMPLPPWMPPPEAGEEPTSAAERFFEEEGATDVSTV